MLYVPVNFFYLSIELIESTGCEIQECLIWCLEKHTAQPLTSFQVSKVLIVSPFDVAVKNNFMIGYCSTH